MTAALLIFGGILLGVIAVVVLFYLWVGQVLTRTFK